MLHVAGGDRKESAGENFSLVGNEGEAFAIVDSLGRAADAVYGLRHSEDRGELVFVDAFAAEFGAALQ